MSVFAFAYNFLSRVSHLTFLFLFARWHIFTAIGGYIGVALVDAITSGEVHEDSTSQLAWPVPMVARLMPDMGVPPKKE